MTKQYEVLHWASLFLKEHNCEQGIAEILLQHHLQVTRSEFYMMMQEPVGEKIIDTFKRDVAKHVETGIPVQHLLGYEMFYGRKFSVNEHVLVPRPETEELVHCVIENEKKRLESERPTIIDIGTGSGIIATTLALEIPEARIYATDISGQALQVATHNATQLGAEITFVEGDFLKPIIDQHIQADIIVSNPPYIAEAEKENLSKTVKDFDPSLALFADDHGLAAYKEIIKSSKMVIKENGIILFEIGFDQATQVSALIQEAYPQSEVSVIQDINKNDRIIMAKL